jgi:hypothetical protein
VSFDWNLFFRTLLVMSLFASITIVVVGYWAWRSLRRIHLPEHLSFVEALQWTPLPVVILLDLLDLVFDIFAAPITWVLLGKIGLSPLRAVTAAEAVIPGTQLIPTMTLAWLGVRLLGFRVGHRNRSAGKTVKNQGRYDRRYLLGESRVIGHE